MSQATPEYQYRRTYRGPLKAVICDWAGTIVDHGSCAPVVAIGRAFAEFGVDVQPSEIRGGMGRHKREHVAYVGALPAVAERWRERHGKGFGDADVDRVYEHFLKLDTTVATEYSQVIPGAIEVFAEFRRRGLCIGTTSGYAGAVMRLVAEHAERQGLKPDCVLSSSDTSPGRPAPWMCYHLAERLGFWPMAAAVKIGDTPIDIEEGLNAGMWTIALARTGNLLGLSYDECQRLSAEVLERRLGPIREQLAHAGAHFVVDSISDTPAVLDEIERRLARGCGPV